jgi:lipopolysaccharide cholinephosphotransferase
MPLIRDMQEKEIEMISIVDKVLKKNNIRYWLLGGSVLGSIRHQGFIPWDDDMDIGVMRDNYVEVERLLLEIGNPYHFQSAESRIVPHAPIGHFRFIDDDYTLNNAPTIDIFALDGIPKSKILQQVQRLFANMHHICTYRKAAKNRGVFIKIITFFIVNYIPQRILDWLQMASLKIITQWPCENSALIGNLFGAWTIKETFDRSMFDGFSVGYFENMNLPLPLDTDKYLIQLYGNYMALPPAEKRFPKHRTF